MACFSHCLDFAVTGGIGDSYALPMLTLLAAYASSRHGLSYAALSHAHTLLISPFCGPAV